jgi:hypothetical protein
VFERHAKEERRVGETSAEPLRRSGGAPTGVLPATLLLAVVFAISFALCVKNNDFPLHYHEDEGTKAAQVAADQRNFHQPQLMLEVAQWAWRAAGGPSDSQATVQIGRAVSAAFVALAAVAAATLGYRLGGVAGLYLVGAFVAMCPVPVVYGHYMKEDAARAFGVMLVVLASHVFWTRRTRGAAAPAVLLLGGACAVAASAKFAGAFALGACVPLVFFAGMPAWRVRVVRLALLLAAFVVVGAIVNHRVLGHTRLALERIESEHRHATTRHIGFTMSRPNLFHVAASAKHTMSHVLGLRAGCVGFGLARPRQAGGWVLFLVLFTAG